MSLVRACFQVLQTGLKVDNGELRALSFRSNVSHFMNSSFCFKLQFEYTILVGEGGAQHYLTNIRQETVAES